MKGTIRSVPPPCFLEPAVPVRNCLRFLLAACCLVGVGLRPAQAAVDGERGMQRVGLKMDADLRQRTDELLRLGREWEALPLQERLRKRDALLRQLAELSPEQRRQMRDQIRDHWRNLPPDDRMRVRSEWQPQPQEEKPRVRDEMRERFERMSPDERDRFRETLRERRFNTGAEPPSDEGWHRRR